MDKDFRYAYCLDLGGDYNGKVHRGKLQFESSRGTIEASGRVLNDNQWHHVAGTMAKSGDDYIYSIYVDGQLDGTVTNATGLTATTLGWAIGARYDGTWNYQGLIDDVRIFNHALTPAEVRKLYKP